MSRPKGYRAEAIVVRVLDFAETSQVVHLVTADHGLVAALAKGSHAPRGAFEGGLTLGVLGEADLLPRRGAELELLRSFRVTDPLRGLRGDLDRFSCAEYVIGLLRDLARPALPSVPLFQAGVTALKAISASSPAQAALWVAVFEARALAATGHRPHLGSCVVCGEDPEPMPVFAPAAGGIAHRRCVPSGPAMALRPAERETLERLYTARLADLASEPPPAAALAAIRAIHDAFLPFVLDREPRALRALPRA